MKNYIYGAGKIGARLLKRLSEYNEPVFGYIDSYKKGSYEGCPIVPIQDIDEESRVIISVLNTNSILDIYHTLRRFGIKRIYWYYDAYQKIENYGEDFWSDQCLDMSEWGELIMPHIELHISDTCNLNCKGCSHFSPLYDEINAVYEDKIRDIRSIKLLFDNIFRIDVLGGEPLLNPELKKYIIGLREELPETFIQVYTNGLLFPQLDDDVLKAISDNDIGISVSEYRPTHNMIGLIKQKLDEYGIRYHIAEYDDKQVFNKPLSISEDSKYPRTCISDGCITISGGRIARCPTLMYIEKFNDYFNQNLPSEGIHIIKDYKNGDELLADMKKWVPLCNHCIKCDMKWEVCGKEKKIEDFAVNE